MPIMQDVSDKSSQVAAIGYDSTSQVFAVQFKDRSGDPAGVVYHYADVPEDVAASITGADSYGKAVRQLRGFEFNKVDVSAVESGETSE